MLLVPSWRFDLFTWDAGSSLSGFILICESHFYHATHVAYMQPRRFCIISMRPSTSCQCSSQGLKTHMPDTWARFDSPYACWRVSNLKYAVISPFSATDQYLFYLSEIYRKYTYNQRPIHWSLHTKDCPSPSFALLQRSANSPTASTAPRSSSNLNVNSIYSYLSKKLNKPFATSDHIFHVGCARG